MSKLARGEQNLCSLFVGFRYIRARRRNRFISFISMSSVLGISLGVAVLITVLSVMNGFEEQLQIRILGMVSHVVVKKNDSGVETDRLRFQDGADDWQNLGAQLTRHSQVVAVAPVLEAQGMLSSRGRVSGISLLGVEPEQEQKVSIFAQHMIAGDVGQLRPGSNGIILGAITARKLGLTVGQRLTFIYPRASDNAAGVDPRFSQFEVVGLFEVGSQYDSLYAIGHIEDLQNQLAMDKDEMFWRLRLSDLLLAPQVAKELRLSFQGEQADRFKIRDWTQSHGEFFQAVALEKTMMSLLLLLIVAVAAFNIVSSSVMMVSEKSTDIAILRTLGASPESITRIFMVQGTITGTVGALLGLGLGILGALYIGDGVRLLEDVLGVKFFSAYFIDYLPSKLMLSDVLIITVSALVLSFFATIYPARRAAEVQPAEALRYE